MVTFFVLLLPLLSMRLAYVRFFLFFKYNLCDKVRHVENFYEADLPILRYTCCAEKLHLLQPHIGHTMTRTGGRTDGRRTYGWIMSSIHFIETMLGALLFSFSLLSIITVIISMQTGLECWSFGKYRLLKTELWFSIPPHTLPISFTFFAFPPPSFCSNCEKYGFSRTAVAFTYFAFSYSFH